MSSSNSRLLRPVVTHRRTQGVLMGCPHRKVTVARDGTRAAEDLNRRPQVVVSRFKGEGMTLVRVER